MGVLYREVTKAPTVQTRKAGRRKEQKREETHTCTSCICEIVEERKKSYSFSLGCITTSVSVSEQVGPLGIKRVLAVYVQLRWETASHRKSSMDSKRRRKHSKGRKIKRFTRSPTFLLLLTHHCFRFSPFACKQRVN